MPLYGDAIRQVEAAEAARRERARSGVPRWYLRGNLDLVGPGWEIWSGPGAPVQPWCRWEDGDAKGGLVVEILEAEWDAETGEQLAPKRYRCFDATRDLGHAFSALEVGQVDPERIWAGIKRDDATTAIRRLLRPVTEGHWSLTATEMRYLDTAIALYRAVRLP